MKHDDGDGDDGDGDGNDDDGGDGLEDGDGDDGDANDSDGLHDGDSLDDDGLDDGDMCIITAALSCALPLRVYHRCGCIDCFSRRPPWPCHPGCRQRRHGRRCGGSSAFVGRLLLGRKHAQLAIRVLERAHTTIHVRFVLDSIFKFIYEVHLGFPTWLRIRLPRLLHIRLHVRLHIRCKFDGSLDVTIPFMVEECLLRWPLPLLSRMCDARAHVRFALVHACMHMGINMCSLARCLKLSSTTSH